METAIHIRFSALDMTGHRHRFAGGLVEIGASNVPIPLPNPLNPITDVVPYLDYVWIRPIVTADWESGNLVWFGEADDTPEPDENYPREYQTFVVPDDGSTPYFVLNIEVFAALAKAEIGLLDDWLAKLTLLHNPETGGEGSMSNADHHFDTNTHNSHAALAALTHNSGEVHPVQNVGHGVNYLDAGQVLNLSAAMLTEHDRRTRAQDIAARKIDAALAADKKAGTVTNIKELLPIDPASHVGLDVAWSIAPPVQALLLDSLDAPLTAKEARNKAYSEVRAMRNLATNGTALGDDKPVYPVPIADSEATHDVEIDLNSLIALAEIFNSNSNDFLQSGATTWVLQETAVVRLASNSNVELTLGQIELARRSGWHFRNKVTTVLSPLVTAIQFLTIPADAAKHGDAGYDDYIALLATKKAEFETKLAEVKADYISTETRNTTNTAIAVRYPDPAA